MYRGSIQRVLSTMLIFSSLLISQIAISSPSNADTIIKTGIGFSSKGMFPSFSVNQTDYAIRNCSANTIITFKNNNEVVVNGKKYRKTWNGKTGADQIITVTLKNSGAKKYYIRCLPTDFPILNFSGATTSGYYLIPYQLGKIKYYIISDGAGVPLWYSRSNDLPANILAYKGGILTQSSKKEALRGSRNNEISFTTLAGVTSRTISGDSINLDAHHIGRTIEGGLLVLGAEYRPLSDLNGLILGANALTGECPISPVEPVAIGARIYEYDKNGNIIWQWNALDHLGKQETAAAPYLLESDAESKDGCAADLHHINWAEEISNEDAIITSLYTTGAVYSIRKSSGEILWKIGGIQTNNSLTIIGDPMSQPLGLHGGEMREDGTLLIFDNRRLANEPGRGVIYKIDAVKKTATFIRSFIPESQPCTASSGTVYCPSWAMGGISSLNNGNVLVSWGDKFDNINVATVFNQEGKVITNITDPTSRASIYRVQWEAANAWDKNKIRLIANSKITLP